MVFCICTAEVCMSGLSRRTLRQLWYVVCCAWWDYQVHGFAQVIFSAWYLAVFPEPCERRQDVACSLFAKVVCLQQGWLKKLLDRMMFRTSITVLEQLNSSVSNLCWSNLTGSSMYDFSPTPTYPTFWQFVVSPTCTLSPCAAPGGEIYSSGQWALVDNRPGTVPI